MKAFDRFLQRWRIRVASQCILPGQAVLDVGSSEGELFDQVSDISRYVGIDQDLKDSRSHGSGVLLRGRFPEAIRTCDTLFDVITLLAVLEHIPLREQQKFAQSCFDRLVPGGRVVITVPSPYVDHILKGLMWLQIIDGMEVAQHYGYNAESTPALFVNAGFELELHRKFQLGFNNLFVFKRPENL